MKLKVKDPQRYKRRHAWYLADALVLVQELQALVWPLGWHVALGGGVLTHGYSDKDVDLYLLPLNSKMAQPSADLIIALNAHFGITAVDYANASPQSVAEFEAATGFSWEAVTSFEHSVKYTVAGKQVDVFVVRA